MTPDAEKRHCLAGPMTFLRGGGSFRLAAGRTTGEGMSLHEYTIVQSRKMLTNLDHWLEAGVAHAQKKSFDPGVLLAARLAPDQYALTRQIQAACDAAKFAAARLGGKEAPKHPDTEQTMDEVRKRIQSVIAYLDTFTEADFVGAESRVVELPFLEGKIVLGSDYLREMVLPNFYFHVTTAYAILRHNGVEIGKRDFIGSITTHDK
jgi:uncharacterized protein